MESHRHAGPKSDKYNEVEQMIDQYYDTLRNKKRQAQAKRFAVNIRKHILIHGCPEDDIIAETAMNNNSPDKSSNPQQQDSRRRLLNFGGGFKALPTIRKVEDTLRGKVWRLMLGVGTLDATDYRNQIKKKENTNYYVKIRGDTKRTFLTSEQYNSRVAEERLVRVLNSFVHKHDKPYCQGMDAIAAGLLYVMPELDAFWSFSRLMNVHFPTYFYSGKSNKPLVGAYAGSFLSWDVLRICDNDLFEHLKMLPAHTYLFPLVASFQAISQPFTEMQKLWDFLFCFGVHLNPVLAAAQIMVNKQMVLRENPARLLQGLLSQRKWMNQRLDHRSVIDCAMQCIIELKKQKHKKLWKEIALHSSDFTVALQIYVQHENGMQYTVITDNTANANDTSSKVDRADDDFSDLSGAKITSSRNANDDEKEQ